MRQIIPFKKELLLSTKINEVTSISLEHTLSLKEDTKVTGEFIISGDYKMTEASINREKFNFNLPVEIDLDANYNYEKATIDIDNFYYEIIDDDSIKVNIDVYVDAEINEKNNNSDRNKDDEKENVIIDNEDVLTPNQEETSNTDMPNKELKEKIPLTREEEKLDESIKYNNKVRVDLDIDLDKEIEDKIDDNNEKIELFNTNNFNNETYSTYYVYIVKEEDTIDSILEKFNTNKEQLSPYNDLDNIKKGTKLIIPQNNE